VNRAIPILLLAAACRPPPPELAAAAPGAPFVSLERQECLGDCPVYRVSAYRDGSVRYEGDLHVERRGRYTGRISAAQIRELDELFAARGFFALADAYSHIDWTCQPGTVLGYVSPDGRAKTIDHYYGDTKAPMVLVELEHAVDRAVDVEKWVGDMPILIPAAAYGE
jgi:hypothetical protein